MQWTISTSGAQEARATSTQTPTVSRFKTTGRRNMLQHPVLQVGGDIQMSLDINEAIKEDIQVSAITSKSTFRDFTLLWHSSLQFDTNTGDRGKWRWLGGKLRSFSQSMWTQPVFCGHFFLINTNIVHPTEECGFVFLNVWIKTLSSRSRILDFFLCFPPMYDLVAYLKSLSMNATSCNYHLGYTSWILHLRRMPPLLKTKYAVLRSNSP